MEKNPKSSMYVSAHLNSLGICVSLILTLFFLFSFPSGWDVHCSGFREKPRNKRKTERSHLRLPTNSVFMYKFKNKYLHVLIK